MSKFREFVSDIRFNLPFKIVIFGCLAYGTIDFFVASGIKSLVMYTHISILLVTLEYLLLIILIIIKYDYHKRWVQVTRLCANAMLLMTFVVFGLVLTPGAIMTQTYSAFSVPSIFKHFVCPILMIFDYFVIDREQYQLKKRDFLIAFSLTLLYTIFIYIRGAIRTDLPHVEAGGSGARYPYFFFDPYLVGYWFEGGTMTIKVGIFPWIIILLVVVSLLIFGSMKIKKKSSYKLAII